MTDTPLSPSPASEYGARPVAVDTVRGCVLTEVGPEGRWIDRSPSVALPPTPQVIADRLALAHWPWGHQIFVCSLAGGAGRTTVSGLVASILAEQPFAHVWPPVALAESEHRALSTTATRWGVIDDLGEGVDRCTRSGVWAFLNGSGPPRRDDFSAILIDAPRGLPCHNQAIADDPNSSVLLLVRPDRASVAEAAEALVWMCDEGLLARRRTVVVINHGAGTGDRGSRAAATALWTRCAAVHSLPFDTSLGPGRVLPSRQTLSNRVINHVALDLWASAIRRPRPAATY